VDPLAVHAPGQADLNLYAYVHGRVLNAVDPLGLQEAESKQFGEPQTAAADQPVLWSYGPGTQRVYAQSAPNGGAQRTVSNMFLRPSGWGGVGVQAYSAEGTPRTNLNFVAERIEKDKTHTLPE